MYTFKTSHYLLQSVPVNVWPLYFEGFDLTGKSKVNTDRSTLWTFLYTVDEASTRWFNILFLINLISRNDYFGKALVVLSHSMSTFSCLILPLLKIMFLVPICQCVTLNWTCKKKNLYFVCAKFGVWIKSGGKKKEKVESCRDKSFITWQP